MNLPPLSLERLTFESAPFSWSTSRLLVLIHQTRFVRQENSKRFLLALHTVVPSVRFRLLI